MRGRAPQYQVDVRLDLFDPAGQAQTGKKLGEGGRAANHVSLGCHLLGRGLQVRLDRLEHALPGYFAGRGSAQARLGKDRALGRHHVFDCADRALPALRVQDRRVDQVAGHGLV